VEARVMLASYPRFIPVGPAASLDGNMYSRRIEQKNRIFLWFSKICGIIASRVTDIQFGNRLLDRLNSNDLLRVHH
jgi:hypothetical protein